MTRIIKNRQAVADDFILVTLAEGEAAENSLLPEGAILVPLAVWNARKLELAERQARGVPVGVWLDVTEGPETIADDLSLLALVGVNFPKFTDGRGYSTARLLRDRYAYQGELRAIGDVLHDQLFYMTRCGFDAFALKEGKNTDLALQAFETFKTPYQAAVDNDRPLFRRRAA